MPTVVILTAPGMWELRDNLTPYDAAYVALADLTGPPSSPATSASQPPPAYAATFQIIK